MLWVCFKAHEITSTACSFAGFSQALIWMMQRSALDEWCCLSFWCNLGVGAGKKVHLLVEVVSNPRSCTALLVFSKFSRVLRANLCTRLDPTILLGLQLMRGCTMQGSEEFRAPSF